MARRKEPEPEGGAYLTTYADMVTLLMAFFVLLFAMSSVDEAKFIVLLKGLEENFGNSTLQSGVLNGGSSVVGANLAGGSTIPVPGGSLSILDSPDSIVGEVAVGEDEDEDPTEGEETGGPGEEDGRMLSREELDAVRGALEVVLVEAGLQDDVSFHFNERGLAVAIATDDVLFATGSAELIDGVNRVLDVVAPALRDFDNVIFVDGHTDDVPFGGEDYTNLDLATDRAVAVAKELSAAYGIRAERLVPTGYAEWRPIDTNDTAEGRARNRRVELVIAAASSGDASQPIGDVTPAPEATGSP